MLEVVPQNYENRDQKNVFFHIGLHKTGSTTLQAFLHQNKSVLASHGYLYPETGIPDGFHCHHNLAWLFGQKNRAQKKFGTWEKLREEIESINLKNVIITSEDFESNNKNFVENIARELNLYSTKIVVYLRRQDLRLESQYTQSIKTGMYANDILSFYDLKKQQLNYYELLKTWEKVFGINNLIIRPLEKKQIPNICHDFLEIIGIKQNDKFTTIKNHNVRPGRKTLEVLKLLNKINIDQKDKNKKKKDLRDIINFTKKHWEDNYEYRLLFHSDAAKILNNFQECNEKIAKEYLKRKDSTLFYEDLNFYEDQIFNFNNINNEELFGLLLFYIKKKDTQLAH